MSDDITNNDDNIEQTISSLDGEDSLSLTPTELYEQLCLSKEGELLITILPEHFDILKNGIIQVKGKENMRLKAKGLAPNKDTLEFVKTDSKLIEGAIQVHIALIKKAGIPILAITTPDGL